MLNGTTGCYNTALGACTLQAVNTGDNNVAVGRKALFDNTSGHSNTGIGNDGLTNVTSGFNNSSLGFASGLDLTTGDNNLLLGHDAGRVNSPSGKLQTQDNQIVLGDNSITDLWCADTSISSSDQRDKTDVEDFNHGLDFVKKLKPKTYKWDKRTWYVSGDATSEDVLNTVPDGSKKKDRINIGFMAQDVLALENEIGFGNNKNDMLFTMLNADDTAYGLKYERLVPVLVNAIKELSEENKDLKSRIEALESN